MVAFGLNIELLRRCMALSYALLVSDGVYREILLKIKENVKN